MFVTQKLVQENSKLKREIEKLRNQLMYDSLTKVKSKAELLSVIDRRSDVTETLVIAFDIKNFGEYNKIYGHLEGDKYIQLLAEKLKEFFRSSDDVYRFGGDEFIAVLGVSENLSQVEDILNRLNDSRINETCYIGLAKGLGLQELIQSAFKQVENQKLAKIKE